jgi:hypothetical protein
MWQACERREEWTRFWWESRKKRDHLEDRGVDERMGSEWSLGGLVAGMEWIQLAQDRDRWRTLGEAVIDLRVLGATS